MAKAANIATVGNVGSLGQVMREPTVVCQTPTLQIPGKRANGGQPAYPVNWRSTLESASVITFWADALIRPWGTALSNPPSVRTSAVQWRRLPASAGAR